MSLLKWYLPWLPSLASARQKSRFIQSTIQQSLSSSSPNIEQEVVLRRQRQINRKRKQGGETFVDYIEITAQGGRGGDGCVAFNREKFKPFGPPSGANGGRGSDIFVLPTPHLTTLSSISKNIRGENGGNGQGTWMNGRHAPPTVIFVPMGTVVRELTGADAERVIKPWDNEEKELQSLPLAERLTKLRSKRWVHYPGAEEGNLERDNFKEAERILSLRDSERRSEELQTSEPIYLDLDEPNISHPTTDLSLRSKFLAREVSQRGFLLASGGVGGIGNSAFATSNNRSPKYATRGTEGQRRVFSFELKILADIGLVGFPNAGKSTLLKALTGGRSKTEVAEYAFTTLNPVIGVVRLDEQDSILSNEWSPKIIENTKTEREHYNDMIMSGDYSNGPPGGSFNNIILDNREAFRFTMADNPGLISHASENVGLGHSFLRSIERSSALVYVVDFSGPSPEEELRVLRDELEKYKPGLSLKARMVLANKADLLAQDGSDISDAKEKLKRLEKFVQDEMRTVSQETAEVADALVESESSAGIVIEIGKPLDVVPVSAKFSQNLRPVVRLLRHYLEEARQWGKS